MKFVSLFTLTLLFSCSAYCSNGQQQQTPKSKSEATDARSGKKMPARDSSTVRKDIKTKPAPAPASDDNDVWPLFWKPPFL